MNKLRNKIVVVKNLDKYIKKLKKVNLMDDLKFQLVSMSKEAIEEILRVNSLKIGGKYNMSGLSGVIFRDGKKEGREEGLKKGAINAIVKAVKDGFMTITNAAKSLNMSEKEFSKLLKT